MIRVKALLILSVALSQVQTSDAPVPNDRLDTPPRLLKQKKPKYPREAFRQQLEGMVVLEIVIDESGKVADARVINSAPEFDAAAVEAVLQWKFAPARKDGRAVKTTATAPVSFCLYTKNCRSEPGTSKAK